VSLSGSVLKPYRDATGSLTIGAGHSLTADERRTGTLIIGDQRVDYRSGITKVQAAQLLEQDLVPARQEVVRLVKVKLTPNQLDALTSFVWNVGPLALQDSDLLNKLNAGRYDEVPKELMKWDQVGGQPSPGLVAARKREVELWNR